MKFINSNNHIIINIDNENYLVDTGLPISFNFNGTKQVVIDGMLYTLPYNSNSIKSNVEKMTKTTIDGFIGLDIISKTGLTIDYTSSEIFFESKGKLTNEIKFERYSGVIILIKDFIVNSKKVSMATLDIGAYQNVLCSDYVLENDKTDIEYYDYNPILKDMHGYLYKACMEINNKEYSIMVETITENNCKSLDDFEFFVNPKSFVSSKLIIDFNSNKIYYE